MNFHAPRFGPLAQLHYIAVTEIFSDLQHSQTDFRKCNFNNTAYVRQAQNWFWDGSLRNTTMNRTMSIPDTIDNNRLRGWRSKVIQLVNNLPRGPNQGNFVFEEFMRNSVKDFLKIPVQKKDYYLVILSKKKNINDRRSRVLCTRNNCNYGRVVHANG